MELTVPVLLVLWVGDRVEIHWIHCTSGPTAGDSASYVTFRLHGLEVLDFLGMTHMHACARPGRAPTPFAQQ